MSRSMCLMLSLTVMSGGVVPLVGSAQDAASPTNVSTPLPSTANPPPATTAGPSSGSGEPQMETGVTRTTFPNVPLLVTGSVLLAGAYVPAVVLGAVSDREDDDDLYIPVAGPWMTLTQGADENAGRKTFLVIDGVVQGAGALAMLTSFMIPERTTRDWYLIGANERIRLLPQGLGLNASGRF